MTTGANSYLYGIQHVWDTYPEHVSGAYDGRVCAVFGERPDAAAVDALEKSFARMGYPAHGVTFVTLSHDPERLALAGKRLFDTIEGLDPLCLIIADTASANALFDAFGCWVEPESTLRFFGHETRYFENLVGMLGSDEGKRRLWHRLQTLPHLA